jgi:hypothetical protein
MANRSGVVLGLALVLSGAFLLTCIPDTRPTVLLQVRTVGISKHCASNLNPWGDARLPLEPRAAPDPLLDSWGREW